MRICCRRVEPQWGCQHQCNLSLTIKGKSLDTEKIRAMARVFKNAILRVPPNELALGMQQFPLGACGDTSRLFGAFLQDTGIQGFSYVSGYRGNVHDQTLRGHAWLQRASLVVDLTADQFPDAPPDFLVEEGSAWHSMFRLDTPVPSDFRITGLEKSYRLILEAMGPV